MIRHRKAWLQLEDGSTTEGIGFGADTASSGEVVFNTGMVGYPESLTDPSYHGQILALTYPLIGNYGVPSDEAQDGLMVSLESEKIHVSGLIVWEACEEYSHWQATRSLSEWLSEHGVPGIAGIDTRQLTKLLREKGTMLGRIVSDPQETADKPVFEDPNLRNLVAEVSSAEPRLYSAKNNQPTALLVDCGVKHSIIKAFVARGISILRVPWDHNLSTALDGISGILISNGPGDPKQCEATIEHVRSILGASMRLPILGICLGSQILALAAGADTYKLKYGHRGQNQPCLEVGARRGYITSQNHGYAVDGESLPEDWREWFINLNDTTNEGIIHVHRPFFGAQFHPEASPGPDDTEFLFDMFVRALR